VIWGGAPAHHIIVETPGTGGTIVTGDSPAPISALARQVADRGEAVETLAGQRGEDTASIEEVASERLDASLFDEALAGRLGGFAIPTEPGASVACDRGIPADILVARRSDLGTPIEALGAADISVTGDAMSPIEALSQQRSDGGMALEDVASQRTEPDLPTGALPMLVRESGGPIEWLTSGARTIADTAVELEWDGTAPAVVLSLETGPGRIRLLATPGRARLLRRN
jgi:hypothetical protein